MSKAYALAAAVAALIGAASATQAATVPFSETITQQFGTQPGYVSPVWGSGGTMGADYVTVLDKADSTGNRFYHEISFADLVYDSISSLTLAFKVAEAPYTNFMGFAAEDWRVYGSTNGKTSVADRAQLGSRLDGDTWMVTLVEGSVLDQALASGKMAFWFGDEGYLSNTFKLYSAAVTLDGQVAAPAPVPLPAAGVLLIGALGGLGVLRRRKRAA